mgnify:CR=1 FL=1
MNRKRRSKICCLSGILLLILLLAGVQMTTRTELYQNTPSDGGRSGGKEKQLLANSYAGEYQIDFSYGFEGNYQDGNHVPIRVTITNESAVEFEGYFVFQIKNAAETVEKAFSQNCFRGASGRAMEETAFLRTVFQSIFRRTEPLQRLFRQGFWWKIRLFVSCAWRTARGTRCTVGKKRFRVKASSSPRWKSALWKKKLITGSS